MLIDANSTLVMIGDSITDCGRKRPVGERAGLGDGYVNQVAALLGATYPDKRICVINMGCSGNRVRDLKARWETDVMELKPDWLSIMIGINDVWRQFDTLRKKENQVMIDEYESTLDELIVRTKPLLKGLVLMTPYYIEPNRKDAMRAKMDEYSAVVRKLATAHDAVFVDTQAAFDDVLTACHSTYLAWDRVHPGAPGHMIITRAFLKAVGYEW